MDTTPVWTELSQPRYAPPATSQKFDVIVIGGGITGLTAAWLLKNSGKRVCVLEKNRIGGGETGHTSAHLTYVTDLRPTELIQNFGADAARLTWQAGAAAIDWIERNVEELGINCGFHRVPGFLTASLTSNSDEARSLKDEAKAARQLGFTATYQDAGSILGKPAVSFPNQAIFHPLKYLAALAAAVHGDGCVVCEDAEVTEVAQSPTLITAAGQKLECDHLIVSTHVPLMANTGLVSSTLFQSKLYPYSSYVLGAEIPKGTLSPGLYSDTSDPYYYLRVHSAERNDYAVFGGEDHKTGQCNDTEARYARLTEVLYKILPQAKVDHRWSGQVIETNDGLPFIGEVADRQFDATGYGGNGLTFGTIAGLMARDAVLNEANPWQKLFAPSRKSVRGGLWDYVVENMDFPRYLVSSWLGRSKVKSASDLKNGDGAVISQHGRQVACSRDEHGVLTKVSAVCTHMGCLVDWNKAEQTWDCPCHGSRFLPTGEVIGGPAETPLAHVGRRKQAGV
jgi:glycine/D-amino acid oxidase-like deaminating enzyme/nitrite reductase/ring-hydroxylating ferredoxin subunit